MSTPASLAAQDLLAAAALDLLVKGESGELELLLDGQDPWGAAAALQSVESMVAEIRSGLSRARTQSYRRLAVEYSVAEIASRLGVSRQAVYQQVSRQRDRV